MTAGEADSIIRGENYRIVWREADARSREEAREIIREGFNIRIEFDVDSKIWKEAYEMAKQ